MTALASGVLGPITFPTVSLTLVVFGGTALILLVIALRLVWSGWLARRHARGGSTLHVLAPPSVEPASATMFFAHLAATGSPWWKRRLLGQPHVVFEYAWCGSRFDIRIHVPDTLSARLVADAVRGAWPAAAVTTTTPAAPAIPGDARSITGVLRLGSGDASSLRDWTIGDPLRQLLSAMSGLRAHEHAVLQIAARPAAWSRIRRLRRTAVTFTTANRIGFGSALADLLLPGPIAATRTGPATLDVWQRRIQQRTLERAVGPMLEVAVRYAVATTHPSESSTAKARRRGLADALAAAIGLHGGTEPIRRLRIPGLHSAITARVMRGGTLLTPAEVAALAHLPTDEIVPELPRAGARLVAAARAVPQGGRDTKPLGTAAVSGRKVAINVADARHHMHVVGSTGVGKSTFLLNMILADIRARRGVVVVDPKGDLVADVLARIDPHALGDRLVVIDPDRPNPPGLNPLSGDDPDLVVDHLVGICRRIFERHWGPRADDVLRSALLTLLRKRGATLRHLPSLLSKRAFRAPIVADIDDPSGLGGFWDWYDNLTPGVQSQVIGPVLSRIRALMTRSFVRATLGSPDTTFSMSAVLDGGVLLARLPKGVLGDDTASLMGSIIVAKTWQAATRRAALPEGRRRDACLYLDEAHNFLSLPRSLDDVLAEARGYRLSLVLAHQHMAQMPRELQAAISANARSKVFFTAGPEDARLLARHTLPHLTEHDLAHLDAYTAAARLVVDGRELPAFTLSTSPPAPVLARSGDQSADQSRAHGHPHSRADSQDRSGHRSPVIEVSAQHKQGESES